MTPFWRFFSYLFFIHGKIYRNITNENGDECMAVKDIFVGHLAFEIGKVKMGEISSETRVYEKRYGEIYKTDVISTVYNEVGVVFSVEEADEDDALEYFEKQQAEIYGTFDTEEFNKQYKALAKKKKEAFAVLTQATSVIGDLQKDISSFQKIFNPKDFTESERFKTQDHFNKLNHLSRELNHIERSIKNLK